MNSSKIFVLIAFLLFFSVNVSAEFKFIISNVSVTTIANPTGGSNGPNAPGQNAYYSYPPYVTLEEGNPHDWIELKFTITNDSTLLGEDREVNDFRLRIGLYRLSDPSVYEANFPDSHGDWSQVHNIFIEYHWDEDNSFYFDSDGPFFRGDTRQFTVPVPINNVENTISEYQRRFIGVFGLTTEGGTTIDVQVPTIDIYVHDPEFVPEPVVNDIDAFLDPITCYDSGAPVLPAPGSGTVNPYDPIRCDLHDSNTVYYEVMIEDVNSMHDGTNYYLTADSIVLSCFTFSYSNGVLGGNQRVNHSFRGYPSNPTPGFGGIVYEGFPASCDFLHYASEQPMHSDCGIFGGSAYTGVPEYSVPPNYIEIPDCPAGSDCPLQDQNVYYNVNNLTFEKFLDPAVYTFSFGDQKIFKGTFTNAETGGNMKCTGWVNYKVFDSTGNIVRSIQGSQSGDNTLIHDGSNTRSYDGTHDIGDYYAHIIKLAGHDAFVVRGTGNFAALSSFVRPLQPWVVQIPIRNNGAPWNGANPKDILYIDINLLSDDWGDMPSKTFLLDGSDSQHTLNTDEEKFFYPEFAVNKGWYHQFLEAAAMKAKLYNEKGWIYDLTPDERISNLRLITILHPIWNDYFNDLYGPGACFTMQSIDKLCWWNSLTWNTAFDLNAGEDYNFVLRLRNPFDTSEPFKLSYETSNPNSARLEFEPETNLVPPFSSPLGFGYKYAKLILKNPNIIHGDINYNVLDTSVNYPFVWDNLDMQLRSYSHNLKLEDFKVVPEKKRYSLGEELDFQFVIRNTGDKKAEDINFMVVSSMDPTVRFYAPANTDIPAGGAITVKNPSNQKLPAIPYKGVFFVEATVKKLPNEFDGSDNDALIYLETEYSGDISNLPEIPVWFTVFIVLIVLLVVKKK